MVGRRWAALLVLVAVFAMHGLQCTSLAVDSAAHAYGPAHAAPLVLTGPADDQGNPGSATGPMDAMALDPVASAAAAAVAAMPDASPHSSGDHLWTLCLAVLAAGLAVLLAVRLAPPAQVLTSRARTRGSGRLAPPRPPDLFALCLLRT